MMLTLIDKSIIENTMKASASKKATKAKADKSKKDNNSSSSSLSSSGTAKKVKPKAVASVAAKIESKNNNERTMLPLSKRFQPGIYDVICARGRHAKNHPGNQRFRTLITEAMDSYSNATSKAEKSLVVTNIIENVRNKSPEGGFVKEDRGRWFEVGDHLAREKVGQCLRDSLHRNYKSSTTSKRIKRQEVNLKMHDELDQLTTARITQLSHDLNNQHPDTSDVHITRLMTQANCDMLEAFKRDKTLQKYNDSFNSSFDTTTSSDNDDQNKDFL